MADHDPTGSLLTLLGGGAIGTIVGAVAQAFRKPSAPSEMIAAATAAATSVFSSLERRIDALEAENDHCRTENGRLWAWGHSLEDLLRENGINIPARDLPGSLVVIEGQRTTVLKPEKS